MKNKVSFSVVTFIFLMLLIVVNLILEPSDIAAASPENNFVKHGDLTYASFSSANRLDLFVPNGAGPFPVIIWIHGGGWQNGSKENCLPTRLNFTTYGYAIACINYRLTGEAIFPAQSEDIQAAVRWLRANAQHYQLDPVHFAAWGSSAGGHLAALLGTAGDTTYFNVGDHLAVSSQVQAVVDFYGPTDLVKMVTTPGYQSHAAADSPESKLLGGPVLENQDKAARANPINYVTRNDPPFLIVHGTSDPVVPPSQSQLLHDALKVLEIDTTLHFLQGAKHGGPQFVSIETITLVRQFLDRLLKPDQAPSATATLATVPTNTPERTSVTGLTFSPLSLPGNPPDLEGKRFQLKNASGTVNGILIKPRGAGPFPGVVVNHGAGSNAAQFGTRYGIRFAKAGYVMIACDYTHSNPDLSQGPSQTWDSAENHRRALAVIDILASLAEVKPGKVAMYGNSMGAFLTIRMTQLTDQIKVAGITAGGLRQPHMDKISLLKTPFIILHGEVDTVVPVSAALQLKAVLDSNQVSTSLSTFAGIGHDLIDLRTDEVFTQITVFFDS